MAITNATLATAVNDLIAYWASFNEEYAAWIGGTVGGGPNLDGDYPLTDYEGVTKLVACPAQLEDDVTNLVTGAAGHKAAAEVAQTAAEVAQAAAELAETGSEAARDAALAYRDAALAAQVAAESARSTAIAQAGVATANAALTAADAAATAQDAIDTAADAAAAAASAAAAATFDPALFAALADNETITGQWTVDNSLGMIFKKAGDPDTGYIKYDGASIYLGNNRAGGSIYLDGNVRVINSGNFVIAGGLAASQTADGLSSLYFRAATDHSYVEALGNATSLRMRVQGVEYGRYDSSGLAVTGAIAATGAVTGSNLNVANWDTAFSWGDHAGLYPAIGGDTFTGAITVQDAAVDVLTVERTTALGTPTIKFVNPTGVQGYVGFNDSGQLGVYDGSLVRQAYFTPTGGLYLGSDYVNETRIGQWNTAYGWGDHAGLYSLAAHVHEGTAIDATGITDGFVLTADGAGNAAWEAAAGGGIEEDVAFGTAAMQLALSSSNSGLQIRASGTSGSWARGMGIFKQSDLSRIGGAGFFGSNEAISKFSIGFGSTWWDGTSGDALLELHADGELSLYSALAGNTHFNFQGVGNNYITHGNGDFTRFRGFNGVSTYTTIAEFDDAGLHVSGGRIREGTKSHIMQLDIAGGSYYGMHVNDADTSWIRTTTLGLLPHTSGGASSLGTTAWPFTSIYGNYVTSKSRFRADNANIEGSIGTFGSDVLHYGLAMRGGGHDSTTSTKTGYCRIAFPANTTGDSTMFTMMIHGYDYGGTRGQASGGAWCIQVSGYYYSSENWSNTSARIVSGSPPFDRVLFGEASDARKYILLGTTATSWSYPKVWLTDATFGHSTQDDWVDNDWTIDFSTGTPTGWAEDASSSPVYMGGQIRWDGEYGSYAASKNAGGRITISTGAASGGNDGDIHFKY